MPSSQSLLAPRVLDAAGYPFSIETWLEPTCGGGCEDGCGEERDGSPWTAGGTCGQWDRRSAVRGPRRGHRAPEHETVGPASRPDATMNRG